VPPIAEIRTSKGRRATDNKRLLLRAADAIVVT
jgi:hypothetical protein